MGTAALAATSHDRLWAAHEDCFAFLDPGGSTILGFFPMFSEGISQKRSDIRGPIVLLVGKLGLACIYVRAQEE